MISGVALLARTLVLAAAPLVLAAACSTSEDATDQLALTFDTAEVSVVDPAGQECTLCLWRADDSEERARGLMDVRSLGDAPAMVFVYEEPVVNEFWMRDTLIPLSIAYVDAAGSVIGVQDMAPCDDVAPCPTYPPPGPFTLAVEAPQGTLAALGLVPGSTVTLGGPCDLQASTDTTG